MTPAPEVGQRWLPMLLAGKRWAAIAEATEMLNRLGLQALGDRLPGDLSGGQGQRAALPHQG